MEVKERKRIDNTAMIPKIWRFQASYSRRVVVSQDGTGLPQTKSKRPVGRRKRKTKIRKLVTVVGASVKNAWKSKDTSPLPILEDWKSQHQVKRCRDTASRILSCPVLVREQPHTVDSGQLGLNITEKTENKRLSSLRWWTFFYKSFIPSKPK